ncbi:hypothetical protein Fot_21351 [Forsythia ovata]|uniref:Uncharacterized protein n=1 Tax=Forsythia ovata TaxID=205694 RepID=A0ABD1UUK9_9LAMI
MGTIYRCQPSEYISNFGWGWYVRLWETEETEPKFGGSREENWDNGQLSGEFVEGHSSDVALDKSVAKEINQDLPSMFKIFSSLSEEKDVEISLNLTIRKGQGKEHELDS